MDPISLFIVLGIGALAFFALSGKASEVAAEVGVLRFPQSPVDDNVRITQDFKPGHSGIDFGVPFNGPLFNCAPGIVAQVDNTPDSNSGRFVIVKGRNEFSTVAWSYSHLNDIDVRLGQEIEPGELIGLCGNSGLTRSGGVEAVNREGTAGAHLHFAVLSVVAGVVVRGGFLDPRPFLADVIPQFSEGNA